MTEWRNRPLDRGVYLIFFTDAVVFKARDGQVVNQPSYAVSFVTGDGDGASSAMGRRG